VTRFLAGVLGGVVLALALSAYAARMVGQSGTLDGWSVIVEGEEACSDPEVDIAAREISCN
jgi:hypothetical protein